MPKAGPFGGISETDLSDLSGCRVGGHLSLTLSDKNIILFTIIPFLIAVNVVYLFLCFLEWMKGAFAVEMPGQAKRHKIEYKFVWSLVVAIVAMCVVGLVAVAEKNPGSSTASSYRPGYDYPEPGSPADVYGDTNETGPDTVLLPNGKRYGRKELEAYSWKVSGD